MTIRKVYSWRKVVGSSTSLCCRTCTRSRKRKTQQSNKQESTPWVYMVRQCAYIHGKYNSSSSHWSWNITSSIQEATNFDLSRFLSHKTSFNHLALFLYWTLYFSAIALIFQPFLKKTSPLFCITWSRVYINSNYDLVLKLIQL